MPTWRYETTNAYTQINAHNWHIDRRGRVNFTNEHGQVIAVLNDWQTITRTDAIHHPDQKLRTPRTGGGKPGRGAGMPAKKRCARCHRLVPKGTTYCPAHLREYEGRRGAPTQRGYGREYRTQRLEWAARIEAGERVTC